MEAGDVASPLITGKAPQCIYTSPFCNFVTRTRIEVRFCTPSVRGILCNFDIFKYSRTFDSEGTTDGCEEGSLLGFRNGCMVGFLIGCEEGVTFG